MNDHNIEIRAAFNAWAEAQNPKTYPAEWQAFQAGWQAALASSEVRALRKDAERLDWLADPNNSIGNVQLPTECVIENAHSLRAAIDAARKEQQQ